MAMTVAELVGVPTLSTRLLAGRSGADTEVLWAHSCELPRPWEWLGQGDLLMTTGKNFPASVAEQLDFVRSLASSGVCGLALAEGMDAPPLTTEAVGLAEELCFPILETAYEIPFVALARAVGSHADGKYQARLTRIMRVYDAYRTAVQDGLGRQRLLRHISVELGHGLHVVDRESGRAVLDAGDPLDPPTLQQIVESVAGSPSLPALTRVKVGEKEYVLLPVGTHPGWITVADVSGSFFDVLVLQHVNTIVTIEAERHRAGAERRLAISGRLMGHLMAGNVDSELIKDRLADFDLAQGPWRVVTATSAPPTSPAVIQAALDDAGIPHLVHLKNDVLVILTPVAADVIGAIDAALGTTGQIGVSNDVGRIIGVADAVRQADWAREACRFDGRRIAHYGVDRPLFLPATVAEAEGVVRTVLGPIIDYDERHGTDLVDSLTVFFEENRSWQTASKRLQVHKQTLVYRMRRVGELTGRRLDDLDDISELHLALRTLELMRGS